MRKIFKLVLQGSCFGIIFGYFVKAGWFVKIVSFAEVICYISLNNGSKNWWVKNFNYLKHSFKICVILGRRLSSISINIYRNFFIRTQPFEEVIEVLHDTDKIVQELACELKEKLVRKGGILEQLDDSSEKLISKELQEQQHREEVIQWDGTKRHHDDNDDK